MEKTQRQLSVDIETAKKWYNGNNEELKNLALQIFSKDELREIVCVKSWDDFCKQYSNINYKCYIDNCSDITYIESNCTKIREIAEDRNLLATKEDAEAFLALMQLKRLRDQWWEALDWKPDYTDTISNKYTIILINNIIDIDTIQIFNRFLSFPTREIAEEFLLCFKDLIQKAKELI